MHRTTRSQIASASFHPRLRVDETRTAIHSSIYLPEPQSFNHIPQDSPSQIDFHSEITVSPYPSPLVCVDCPSGNIPNSSIGEEDPWIRVCSSMKSWVLTIELLTAWALSGSLTWSKCRTIEVPGTGTERSLKESGGNEHKIGWAGN